MNATVRIEKEKIDALLKCITLMFQLNYDYIDYIQFYNLTNVIQKIQKINFRCNFSSSKKHSLVFTPNEIRDFLKLVDMNKNLLQQNAYFNALIITICNNLYKHISTIEHQQRTFTSKQILIIPKQISQ